VEDVFKSAKHIPYLKKLNPKHVRAVLDGAILGTKTASKADQFSEFA
jgi:hypothetical protein